MAKLSRNVVILLSIAVCLSGPTLFAARKTPLYGTPAERLIGLVEENETIIVIVSVYLDEPWAPEPKLKQEKLKKQQRDMRSKKDALMARTPGLELVPGRDYEGIPSFAATVDAHALRKLLEDDGVESIRENRRFRPTLNTSVPIVGADIAASQGYGGAGQVVAVIDTGVAASHRFLTGKVVSEACYSTQQYRPADGKFLSYETCPAVEPSCPNQTPCTASVSSIAIGSGAPCDRNGTIPSSCRHGTQIAGVAAGKDDGTVGFNGVARDANLLAINATSLIDCQQFPVADCSLITDNWLVTFVESDLLAALTRVYALRQQLNIAAVNMSLRFAEFHPAPCDSSESRPENEIDWPRAINNLHAANIAVVVASGNDGYTNLMPLPACIGNAVAVGATTDQDTVAPYSTTHATMLDLLAPGGLMPNGIRSSVPGYPPNDFLDAQGTSLAAPHVAGAFAILKQRWPAKTAEELLGILKTTGVSIADNRVTPPIIKPRINIGSALSLDTLPPTMPGSFMATATSTTSVSLAWNPSTDNVGVTSYKVDRRASNTANWSQIWEGNALSVPDSGLSAATAYQYRIRAFDAAGNESPAAADFATTVMYEDDPIREPYDNGGTSIRGIHMARLREAADAWRVFAGLSRLFTYENATGSVLASHFTGVVDALNAARDTVGLSAFAYANVPAPAVSVVIDDDHVQQLRNAMK